MKFVIGCLLVTSLVFSSAGTPVPAQASAAGDATHRAMLLQLIQSLTEQIVYLRAELDRQEERAVTAFDEPTLPYRTLREYAPPRVGTKLSLPNDLHEDFFKRVLKLTPPEYRSSLAGLLVYDGRSLTSDAYVYGQKRSDGTFRWFFGVNDDTLRDHLTIAEQHELIVHELAHIIGLRDSLMPGAGHVCHAVVATGENCPDPNSILGQFIATFWSKNLLDELQMSNGKFRANQQPGYARSFVSNYASVNPYEDFAESFMVFVLNRGNEYPSAATNEKVAFFAQFSEMNQLKTVINRRR